MELINWRIAAHPLNWLTVFLMVFLAGIAIHFVLVSAGMLPAAAQAAQQQQQSF